MARVLARVGEVLLDEGCAIRVTVEAFDGGPRYVNVCLCRDAALMPRDRLSPCGSPGGVPPSTPPRSSPSSP